MKDIKQIKELFIMTEQDRYWQVDWREEDDKLHYIQELCPFVNNTSYKDVKEAVFQSFGYEMPTQKEFKKIADECWENESAAFKRRNRRRPFSIVYLIKDYQKII